MIARVSGWKGGVSAYFISSHRMLGRLNVGLVLTLFVGFATVVAILSHLLVHFLTAGIFDTDPHGYPWRLIALNAGLAAIITASPILLYCMELIRSLRETKRELRKAVAAAEAANQAKSTFLANMSHEIRTPLNGVLGMADVLYQEDLLPRQADQVRTIRESGKALMAILNDVLDFSKIEAGKLEISAVETNLHHVFHSVHKLFLPQADEKNIALSLELDDSVPRRARFDTVRVRQCVSNFVSNALKFTEKGSVIMSVSAVSAIDGRYLIRVDVADTGIGMSEDTAERLFTDFTQADHSTSRKFGGTGLGLAISRKLARLMHGDVSVISREGEGSVFSFTFRAAPALMPAPFHDEAEREAINSEHSLMGLRCLLVDDNAVNRKVVRMLLKPAKMEFVDAENGRDALDLLAAQPFDLVLLDVHMPVMDGIAAIKLIRESTQSWRDVPVIALTADAMSGDRERLMALGMTGYVTKPVDQRTLVSEIMRVCGLAREKALALSAAAP